MPEFKIECPCCKAEIIIDAESGGILSHTPHKNTPKSLEEWMKSDKDRSRELAEKFPDMWLRIQARRQFMQEVLGIRLKPEVLPFSNIPGYLPPFVLRAERVLVVAR